MLVLLNLQPLFAQPLSMEAIRIRENIRVDGVLDEAVYESAEKHYLKNNVNGTDVWNTAYLTSVQVMYDLEYLYIGFTCWDRDIHSSFSERDAHVREEEAVQIFIDTDRNQKEYIQIDISPRDVLYDAWIVDPDTINPDSVSTFNLEGIRTGVAVEGSLDNREDDDLKWTVEVAIPFEAIVEKFNPRRIRNYQWRVNFYRVNKDKYGLPTLAWSPTLGSFHQPGKFGFLTFE